MPELYVSILVKKYLETKSIEDRNKLIEYYIPWADKLADSLADEFKMDNNELRSVVYEELVKAIDNYDGKYYISKFVNSHVTYNLKRYVARILGLSKFIDLYFYKNCNETILEEMFNGQKPTTEYEENAFLNELINKMAEAYNVKNIKLMGDKLYNSQILSLNQMKNELEFNMEEEIDIDSLLDFLNDDERTIIEYHYGLRDKEAMPLKNVAELLDNSEDNIYCIERKAFRRIRNREKTIRNNKK